MAGTAGGHGLTGVDRLRQRAHYSLAKMVRSGLIREDFNADLTEHADGMVTLRVSWVRTPQVWTTVAFALDGPVTWTTDQVYRLSDQDKPSRIAAELYMTLLTAEQAWRAGTERRP